MRLPDGGSIDRGQPLAFTFNGHPYTGFAGDTLASALLANGVRVVARSLKFHRPRGIYSCGEEEPCALLEVGIGAERTPNIRATQQPLYEGLSARGQLGWPSVNFDLGRSLDFTHRLWRAGFYHRTFKWPNWRTWEGAVRRMAGLGHAPAGPDPARYEQVNLHCDLLIAGAGPAGIMAALVAGRSGLRVVLAEQDSLTGGSLLAEPEGLTPDAGPAWARQATRELQSLDNVILLRRATVTAIYDSLVTTVVEQADGPATPTGAWRECLWLVRPRAVLLATGAIEQGLVFPGNDRPGVMLAGSVRQYLNRYAVTAGKRVLLATNNDTAYRAALDLHDRGVRVEALADQRDTPPANLAEQLRLRGVPVFSGTRVTGTRSGLRGLRAVRLRADSGRQPGWRRCDVLAVSGGWAPRVHLLAHARASLRFDTTGQCFMPESLPSGISVAGALAGTQTLTQVLEQASECAAAIVRSLGGQPRVVTLPPQDRQLPTDEPVGSRLPRPGRGRQWLDLLHDVTLDDAELAVREGFDRIELFKRFTTTGMAADQGKTGNLNAALALGMLTGAAPEAVGTTTFRPPYVPVSLGTLAGQSLGRLHAPRRDLPAAAWHARHGAVFGEYGWLRPDCYPLAGETAVEAERREVTSVRTRVGLFDNSPIGKLEVQGSDAARFLEHFYINDIAGLAVGRARYGLMLNENGVIIDDGVVARLAPGHFLLHTTSAGATRITDWMEEWLQCEWPDSRVVIDNQTSQWACVTVAGPRARTVLQSLPGNIDFSAANLPHMGICSGELAGLSARVARISYSGECSFEISVPARSAEQLLDLLWQVGQAHGICAYGIEALMILRLEKGHFHPGTDTDGATCPDDVGWGAVAQRKAPDYIGRRSLARPANQATGRRQLVGVQALDPGQSLRTGTHFALRQDATRTEFEGWLTSAALSPTLGRHIALGMLRDGRSRLGETLELVDGKERYPAQIVALPFFDPANARLHA